MRQPLLTAFLTAGSAILGLSGCGGTEPPVPTTVQLDSPSLSFVSIGETRQLTAAVRDQRGDPITSPTIIWAAANTAVANVSSTGVVTAVGTGSTQVTASAGGASATAEVQVSQVPAQVQKVGGDGQSGPPGQQLPAALTIQVNDARGNSVAGVAVGFTLTSGNAAIATPTATTGADGRASTALTPVIAGPLQVRAAVDANVAATFTLTSVSQFDIQLRFLTTPTASQSQAFTAARKRWESLVVGDLPDVILNVPAGSCPAVNEQIDDLVIFVSVLPIDGVGAVLAQAGPCFIRTSGGLSILGLMRLDSDDLDALEAQGLLEDVILHEMGHVIGFGSLWPFGNLLADAALDGGTDPHFTGPQGILAFDDVGGTAYSGGEKVPVENLGGMGTADAHWRESVFANELMTGFVDHGVNPLSTVTIASLADEGYVVNLLGADPYSLAPAARARARGPAVPLGNDVMRMPIGIVGAGGQITGVIQP